MEQTISPIVFTKMNWADAKKVITRSLSRPIANQILAAGDSVATPLRNKAFVYLARYCFGTDIISSGQLSLPKEDSDGRQLEGLAGVPVSLVLSNQVEVYLPGKRRVLDYSYSPYGYLGDQPTTLRLLGTGELFGTFEAVARMLKLPQTQDGSWNVCAGSRAALLIYPFESKKIGTYKKLEKLMEESPRLMEKSPRDLGGPLRAWLWHLMLALSTPSDWSVETIVFPEQWEHEQKSWAWQRLIVHSAWLQMKDDKENELNRTRLLAKLAEVRIPSRHQSNKEDWKPFLSELEDKQFALRLLQILGAVAAGRLPAYVPYNDVSSDNSSGPFAFIVKELLAALGEGQMSRNSSKGTPSHPTVLIPKYLNSGESGLISLRRGSHLAVAEEEKRDQPADVKALRNLGEAIIATKVDLAERFPSIDWEKLKLIVPSQAGAHSSNTINPKDIEGLMQLTSGDKRAYVDHPFFRGCVILKKI